MAEPSRGLVARNTGASWGLAGSERYGWTGVGRVIFGRPIVTQTHFGFVGFVCAENGAYIPKI